MYDTGLHMNHKKYSFRLDLAMSAGYLGEDDEMHFPWIIRQMFGSDAPVGGYPVHR